MSAFHLFEYRDYREALREAIEFRKKRNRSITLQKIAEKIEIQYTYLSRTLRSKSMHLSEDHIYSIGEILGLLPEETEFLLLLRAFLTCRHDRRKKYLISRIEDIAKKKIVRSEYQEASPALMTTQMDYLFNPMAPVVHIALWIKEYQNSPGKLRQELKLSPTQFKSVLERLEENGFIEWDRQKDRVRVLRESVHFGREHPLMRMSQMMMKTDLISKLQNADEDKKESVFFTFTTDEAHFEKVRTSFKNFLKEAQKITDSGTNQIVCQMSFDLVRWF